MGGDRHILSFHLHIPHLHHHEHDQDHHHHHHHHHHIHDDDEMIPKGYVGIRVGQGEEGQKRFVIPVVYVNHPLFMQLLKEAEEEYGFDHKGPITIPCHVEQFQQVQGLINKENLHHHHHHHHFLCFKV